MVAEPDSGIATPDHGAESKEPPQWENLPKAWARSKSPLIPERRIDTPPHGPFTPQPGLAKDAWVDVLCRHVVFPHAVRDGALVLAASTYADALRAAHDLRLDAVPITVRLTSKHDILTALTTRYAPLLTLRSTSGLRTTAPDLSAATKCPQWMRYLWIGTSLSILAALLAMPAAAMLNLWLVFIPYFLATMLLRAVLILSAVRSGTPPPPPRIRTPVVSILVPVYREAESLPALIRALKALDYPVRALDIKILLEEDDTDTIAEARWLTAGTHIDCLVVPSSHPRTKPKAMNFALPFVRGEIVGIFDAEDAPEVDQISKAVATLEAAGEEIACAQARLSHYNPNDNLLTRCVAMEYALWFDMLLTGLSRARLPVPLGGTSLYFRTDILREIGGWDPHNVTEDADLGLRLARAGKRATVFDSTTFEEATDSAAAWIRQRSRWIKGFMLTWAVHMRDPARLARDLGWGPMLAINVLLLDGFLSFLLQPIILLSALVAMMSEAPPWLGLFQVPGATILLASLFAGQALLLCGAFIAARGRFGWRMAISAPLLWPYWMMGGVAAIKALLQIATKPQFWEKTVHCVSPVAKARRDDVLNSVKRD